MEQPQPTPEQKKSNSNYRVAAGSIVLASAALMAGTVREEGVRYVPYYDTVGVKTVCMGDTNNVQDRKYSKEECNEREMQQIRIHGEGVLVCIKVPLAQTEYEAYEDLAYNVGVGAFCRSTAVKKVNAGDYAGGCQAILLFNKNKELAARRQREFNKCNTPVDTKKEVPNVVVTQVARSEDNGLVAVNSVTRFWKWISGRS